MISFKRLKNPKIRLVFLYSFFALIAISINLLVQFFVLNYVFHKYAIYLAMFFGTISGMLIRYSLDSKYIFNYKFRNFHHSIIVLLKYTSMSVITTLIFWLIELLFYFLSSGNKLITLSGAFLALIFSYYLKYNLDKKFVFH